MIQKLSTLYTNTEPGASDTLHEAEALPEQWSALLGAVQSGDPDGLSKFHKALGRGLRFILSRERWLGNTEVAVLDVLADVIAEIKQGSLSEPQELPRFVMMMARRRASRPPSDPQREERETGIQPAASLAEMNLEKEKEQMIQRKTELAEKALTALNPQQHELLSRRYLHGQTNEQICAAMNLTETEVRSCANRFRNSFSAVYRKERLEATVASAATI